MGVFVVESPDRAVRQLTGVDARVDPLGGVGAEPAGHPGDVGQLDAIGCMPVEKEVVAHDQPMIRIESGREKLQSPLADGCSGKAHGKTGPLFQNRLRPVGSADQGRYIGWSGAAHAAELLVREAVGDARIPCRSGTRVMDLEGESRRGAQAHQCRSALLQRQRIGADDRHRRGGATLPFGLGPVIVVYSVEGVGGGVGELKSADIYRRIGQHDGDLENDLLTGRDVDTLTGPLDHHQSVSAGVFGDPVARTRNFAHVDEAKVGRREAQVIDDPHVVERGRMRLGRDGDEIGERLADGGALPGVLLQERAGTRRRQHRRSGGEVIVVGRRAAAGALSFPLPAEARPAHRRHVGEIVTGADALGHAHIVRQIEIAPLGEVETAPEKSLGRRDAVARHDGFNRRSSNACTPVNVVQPETEDILDAHVEGVGEKASGKSVQRHGVGQDVTGHRRIGRIDRLLDGDAGLDDGERLRRLGGPDRTHPVGGVGGSVDEGVARIRRVAVVDTGPQGDHRLPSCCDPVDGETHVPAPRRRVVRQSQGVEARLSFVKECARTQINEGGVKIVADDHLREVSLQGRAGDRDRVVNLFADRHGGRLPGENHGLGRRGAGVQGRRGGVGRAVDLPRTGNGAERRRVILAEGVPPRNLRLVGQDQTRAES